MTLNPTGKNALVGTRRRRYLAMSFLLVLVGLSLAPAFAGAADFSGSGFESKMESLQGKFINVLLPLVSILGLVYAAILAASGNEGAKGKILVIIGGSIIGFLAPNIIGWIKGILS